MFSTSRLDGVKPFISVFILIANVLLLGLSARYISDLTNLFRPTKKSHLRNGKLC